MMKPYSVKYRQPGQILWNTLKRVTGDGYVPEDILKPIYNDEGKLIRNEIIPTIKVNRYFSLEDGSLIFISVNAEVVMSKDRQDSIVKDMSKQARQPIQVN